MFACMHAFKGVHMLVCARPFSRVRLRSPLRLRSCVLHALAPLGRPTCARIAVVSSLPVSSRLQGTMRLRRCGAWVCARVCAVVVAVVVVVVFVVFAPAEAPPSPRQRLRPPPAPDASDARSGFSGHWLRRCVDRQRAIMENCGLQELARVPCGGV